jgi:hypothetical protein
MEITHRKCFFNPERILTTGFDILIHFDFLFDKGRTYTKAGVITLFDTTLRKQPVAFIFFHIDTLSQQLRKIKKFFKPQNILNQYSTSDFTPHVVKYKDTYSNLDKINLISPYKNILHSVSTLRKHDDDKIDDDKIDDTHYDQTAINTILNTFSCSNESLMNKLLRLSPQNVKILQQNKHKPFRPPTPHENMLLNKNWLLTDIYSRIFNYDIWNSIFLVEFN